MLKPNPHVNAFGDRAFKELITLNEVIRVGALIQCDWCSYKKKLRAQGCMHTEERPCAQQGGCLLQSKGRGLKRNQVC